MAWTDVVQGARQGALTSIGQRDQRRSGALDRLHDTFGRLGAQKASSSENAQQRQFLQSEAERGREQETSERLGAETFSSEEARLKSQRDAIQAKLDRDHELVIQSDNREFQTAYQTAEQKFQRAMWDAENTAAVDAAQTAFENEIDRLKIQHGIDINFLAAQTDAQKQLMYSEAYIQREDRAWSVYEAHKQTTIDQLWRMEVETDEYGNQMTVWVKRPNITLEDLRDQFNNDIEREPYSDEMKAAMKESYWQWLLMAWESPPDELMSAHDTSITNIDVAADSSSTTGELVGPPGAEELVMPAADVPPPPQTVFGVDSQPIDIASVQPSWFFNNGTPLRNPDHSQSDDDFWKGMQEENRGVWREQEGELRILLDSLINGGGSLKPEEIPQVEAMRSEIEEGGVTPPYRQSEIKSFIQGLLNLRKVMP